MTEVRTDIHDALPQDGTELRTYLTDTSHILAANIFQLTQAESTHATTNGDVVKHLGLATRYLTQATEYVASEPTPAIAEAPAEPIQTETAQPVDVISKPASIRTPRPS